MINISLTFDFCLILFMRKKALLAIENYQDAYAELFYGNEK